MTVETLLGLAVVLLVFAIRAQLKPLTRRCRGCGGRGIVADKSGKNHDRCRRCGGSPERLRFGAWIQLQLGIPVPRTRRPKKRRWMSL